MRVFAAVVGLCLVTPLWYLVDPVVAIMVWIVSGTMAMVEAFAE